MMILDPCGMTFDAVGVFVFHLDPDQHTVCIRRNKTLGSKIITRSLLCACSLVVGGGSDQSTIHEKQLTNVICYMRLTKRQLHLYL